MKVSELVIRHFQSTYSLRDPQQIITLSATRHKIFYDALLFCRDRFQYNHNNLHCSLLSRKGQKGKSLIKNLTQNKHQKFFVPSISADEMRASDELLLSKHSKIRKGSLFVLYKRREKFTTQKHTEVSFTSQHLPFVLEKKKNSQKKNTCRGIFLSPFLTHRKLNFFIIITSLQLSTLTFHFLDMSSPSCMHSRYSFFSA